MIPLAAAIAKSDEDAQQGDAEIIDRSCRRRSCARDRSRSRMAPAGRSARCRAPRTKISQVSRKITTVRAGSARSPTRAASPLRIMPPQPPSACCAIDVITSSRMRWKARSNSAPNSVRIDHFERARPRQTDRNHLLDAARPRRHHDHFVAQQDRLLDRVGDEQHGLVRAVENAQQLLLHDDLGLRVERGERLVHQQDRPLQDQRAGQAPRAGACRPRIGPADAARSRASPTERSGRGRARAAAHAACPAFPARRQHCRRRCARGRDSGSARPSPNPRPAGAARFCPDPEYARCRQVAASSPPTI